MQWKQHLAELETELQIPLDKLPKYVVYQVWTTCSRYGRDDRGLDAVQLLTLVTSKSMAPVAGEQGALQFNTSAEASPYQGGFACFCGA